MRQYNVTGMSCAACSARVEKAVSKLPGVESCSVNLLTNSMGVSGNASDSDIIHAVEMAGYGASVKNRSLENRSAESGSLDNCCAEKKIETGNEIPKLRRRLVASVIFILLLMYVSMGHMMWNWPLPTWLDGNHIAMGLIELLLSAIIMIINQKFFVSGIKGLIHGAPNMDTLVSLGSAASFGWSVYALFAMTDAQLQGDFATVESLMDEFYFESAAMILTLITVGKLLEAYSKGRTTDALKSLIELTPRTAHLLTVNADGRAKEQTVPAERLQVGDIFAVYPGESIPVDGVIIEGQSAVNMASLTGESIPVDLGVDDAVSQATINQSGYLKCRATRVGENTTLSQIIQLVSDAAATKAPIAKIADKVSGVFVPSVIGISILTIIIWLICGQETGFALARGISVLVISCPCALGLATPVAIMVGSGKGARNGILFKNAVTLEQTGRTQIVVFDKTGTITEGKPVVTDLFIFEDGNAIEIKERINYADYKQLLTLLVSLEAKSEHPLAKAVMSLADELQLVPEEVTEFEAMPGNGLKGFLHEKSLLGGSVSFVCDKAKKDGNSLNCINNLTKQAEKLAESGKTPLLFSYDGKLIAMLGVADTIKSDAKEAIMELHQMGIYTIMLTGDNERTAKAIAAQAGVDEVIAGVLPAGKESVIRELKEYGVVAMVGDGINDAPALTRADVGIAIGTGADIAVDAASLVLMKNQLRDVPAAIRLSRKTLTNIKENLFWAFFYNIIGIPLAAGAYYAVWGWKLNPMFGAAAMSLSSFCVVTNALRLNLIKLYQTGHDRRIKNELIKTRINKSYQQNESEVIKMTKTMKIEGMMCGHCEARVKKTLEAIDGVAEAVVSHEAGTAVVTLNADLTDEVLKSAVEAQDYKVLSID